jgi:hypothetical protein
MADNVLPSADPSVATDDVSGAHFQKVKIADGTADSSTIVPATTPADGAAAEVALATKGYAMLWNGATWDRVPGSTSGQYVQGPAAHDAAVAGNPVLMGGYASAAAPAAVSADGDVVRAWMSRFGVQQVGLVDPNGDTVIDADDNTVRVTIASNQATGPTVVAGNAAHDSPVTGNAVLMGGYASAAAPASVSADGDNVNAWLLRNGAQATVLTAAGALIGGDATNGLDVDVTRLPALPAGTNNIGDVDVLTLPGVAGDVAHDGGDSGNPVKVGAKAANAMPTAVANGDRTNNISDLFGRQLTSHIDPAMQVHKNLTYTSTQTGTDVWDPGAGLRIAVTSVIIGTYGTTAGRIILWFGDNADTTFTQNTDQVLVAASFSPSATAKPGLVFTPAFPVFCTTADRELHVTTDAAISFDLTVEGYEF